MSRSENDRQIDYIEIPVRDVAEAKEFYGRVFRWTFTDYGPDYASFSDGRLEGGFRKSEEPGGGGPLIVFYAVALKAVQKDVISAGGRILKPIFSFPGGRRFHFADPSGNELAVWSDPE